MGSAKRGPLCHMVLPILLKILVPVWHTCEFPKNYVRCPPSPQCTWYSEPYHSKQLFGNMSSFYFQRYEFKCNSRNFIIQNDCNKIVSGKDWWYRNWIPSHENLLLIWSEICYGENAFGCKSDTIFILKNPFESDQKSYLLTSKIYY